MNRNTGKIRPVCRFFLKNECRFGQRCWNFHPSQPPQFPQQEELQASTSASSSSESINLPSRVCGICLEPIKANVDFGLLPNCTHCFCYPCLTKWRRTREFEQEVNKACPECRVPSEFVYKSKKWIEDRVTKERLIEKQKKLMKKRHCKHFARGKHMCPFGNTCYYLHALQDGTEVDLGPPKQRGNFSLIFDPFASDGNSFYLDQLDYELIFLHEYISDLGFSDEEDDYYDSYLSDDY